MERSHSNFTPKLVGSVVIGVVLASGGYVFLLKDKTGTNITANVTAAPVSNLSGDGSAMASSTPVSTGATSTTSTVKDGTYTATASYDVPHGNTNTITVKITIKDGVVTAVSDSNDAADRESDEYISSFESRISGAIVGKKLSSLNLYRVGGASLTTGAFDAALTQINRQAQS